MTTSGSSGTCRAVLESDASGRPFLSPREIHHLVRVRRLGEGDVFQGLDRSKSTWYECRLRRRDREWEVKVVARIGTLGESPLEIVLGAALLTRAWQRVLAGSCRAGKEYWMKASSSVAEAGLR